MSLFSEVVAAILAGYLAVAGFVATGVNELFSLGDTDDVGEVIETEENDSFLAEIAELPSKFSSIPDILRNNNIYQQATVIGPDGFTEATADEPIDAIVNVFCSLSTDAYVRTTTGTGFFIDADGVIMTNAHVAQFLLLEASEEYTDAECIIRTGNPATDEFIAELLYIPPAWIQENAAVLNDAVPLGTGERDYALLYVSETTDNTPLPAQFPSLGFDSELLPTSVKDDAVVAAGYPATNLLENGREADLLPKQADTSISELYTFGSNYADVFSIRGSEVGAQGSSGGPVVNEDGDVIGMIATRGDDTVDGEGSLRAITLSHVDRTITEETGFSLEENLSGNLAYRSEVFEATLAPFLLQILEFQN